MKTVKMITLAGDERLHVGACYPATARRLVKQELASWDNGELLIHLKPIYSKFMEQSFG